MNLAPIVKLVRAYDATEWEIFISEWQKGLSGYTSVKRLGRSGDQGRDVIGLCSSRRLPRRVGQLPMQNTMKSRFRRPRRVRTLARSSSGAFTSSSKMLVRRASRAKHRVA